MTGPASRRIYRVRGGCVLCVTCGTVCPADAIAFDRESARIDPDRCTGCGRCLDNCPAEAIESVEVPPRENDRPKEGDAT